MLSPVPPLSPAVAEVFAAYPAPIVPVLLAVREIIFHTAAKLPQTGGVEEVLKWNQPAYLPRQPRVGSTMRIDWAPRMPGHIGLYFNCKTLLVERIRTCYETSFLYAGNRFVWVSVESPLPSEAIADWVEMTLLYHANRRAEVMKERRQG